MDTIINGNLTELYDRDMEGKDLWAAHDMNGTTGAEQMHPKQRSMFASALEKGYRYFNSGVMLLNLEQIRRTKGVRAYIEAIGEWDGQMDAPDQDILNWVHKDAVGYFPWEEYDLFASNADIDGLTYDEVRRKTRIVHYAGVKPWNTSHLHYEIEQIWWDYAKDVPYYTELLEEFQRSVMWDKKVRTQMDDMVKDYERLIETSIQLAERLKGK